MLVASVSVPHFLYSTFKVSQVQTAVGQPYVLVDVTENAESDVSDGSLKLADTSAGILQKPMVCNFQGSIKMLTLHLLTRRLLTRALLTGHLLTPGGDICSLYGKLVVRGRLAPNIVASTYQLCYIAIMC